MTGRKVVAFAAIVAIGPQTLNPSARDIIRQPRALLEAEIVAVLDAARHVLDGRTFRLSYQPDRPGPLFLMGPGGRPRYLRTTSGQFGSAADIEINDSAFDMVPGRVAVKAGDIQRIGGRTVRALTAPYVLHKGALGGPPPGTIMSLWLD